MSALKTKLGLESLELRENPALAIWAPGEVDVFATEPGGCNVTVTQPNSTHITVKDNLTGTAQTFYDFGLGFSKVTFSGGAGNDTFNASAVSVRVVASGNAGTDVLYGGSGDDNLYGGDGADWLFGGEGNNNLYGGTGNDFMYAGAGSDFLDGGGQTGDIPNPGGGQNFIANKPVLNGTTPDDVMQYNTPTCWIDAPLAAAAKAGVDLAGGITYMGGGLYAVQLKTANGAPTTQFVSLEGGKLDFEPNLHGNESWVILYQRAIMQQLGKDWHNLSGYSGGYPDQILPMLTGRSAYSVGESWGSGGHFNKTGDAEMASMKLVLDAGCLVCACTNHGKYGAGNWLGDVTTPNLVENHCYAVVSIDMAGRTITLRNPWGTDGYICADGKNDGLVTITFDQFYSSMWSYSAS